MISFGNNDVAEFEDGSTRTPVADAIRTSVEVVAECRAWRKTLWVGPLPMDQARMPFYSRLLQSNLYYRNESLARLNAEFAATAAELSVPYLNLYSSLIADPGYIRSVGGKDGLHPDGVGYQIIADRVANWLAWQAAVGPTTAKN